MAAITINIPDAVAGRVMDAFASRYGWAATIPDPANPTGPMIANPQAKAQFAKARVAAFVHDIVKAHEAVTAAETARIGAVAKADSEITLS